MSWLGGSISTITGQLSNFTKDILTEGTEEVSDHVTELHLAQKKIQELENTTLALKSENDWLKKLNKDLEDKAECSELQINSISREYRGVLEFKEKENQLLKQQNHELQEAHINSVVSKDQKSPPLESSFYSNSSNRNSGFVNDELDFGENINLQHEVNRLRSSVQHLQSECKHWKSIASQRSSERGESSQVLADIAELQNKNKELEKQFHTEKERHHDEVSALQNMYYQKITDLKKTYQEKLDSQQTSGNETKEAVESAEEKTLKKQLEHSEDEINRLNSYISSMEDKLNLLETAAKNDVGAQKKGETVANMDSDKDKVSYREEKGEGDYRDTLESLRSEIEDLKNQNFVLIKENGNLKKHLEEDSKPVVELEGNMSWDHYDELEGSSNVLQRASHRPFEDLDENDCQNKNASRSEMQEQMSALQNQVEKYEREIERFEYLKSDWQLEKEALEDVLMNLRNQLKDKESANNLAQDQKEELAEVEQQEKNNDDDISFETAEYLLDKAAASLYPLKMGYLREPRSMNSDEEDASSDFSVDIEKFDRQVALLTQANADLEREREYLLQEKHHANDEISYFKDKATSLEEKYTEKVKNEKSLKEKLKEAKHQLAEKDEQIEKLISEKDDVQSSLEELDSQHQEAISQLIDNRHDLAKKVREKSDQIDQLQAELKQIQFQLDTANDTVSKQRSDLEEQSRSQHVSHDQLNELSSEKDRLSNQIEDLKAKLEKAAYVVNELHLDKKELCQKMAEKEEGLNNEIRELAAQNKELELKNSELREKLSQPQETVDTSEMEFRNKCLDKEIQNLKENVKEYAELNRMNEMKLVDNEDRFTKLTKEIDEVKKDNTSLVMKCSALRKENQFQLKATEDKNSKEGFEINHLQQGTDSLSQGLGHVLQDSEKPDASLLLESISSTGELLEDYLVNVLERNGAEPSGKPAEHTKAKQVKMCLAYLKARLKDRQEELHISNQNEEHSKIMIEKCEEIEALRTQVVELRKDLVSSMERIQEFEDISNRNQELEDQVEKLNSKNLELTNEMSVILSNDSKDSANSHCDPKTLDLITDLESELLSSKNKIKSLEKMVCKLQTSSGVAPEKELMKGVVDKNSLNSETSDILSLQAKVEKDEQELRYFKNILQDISSIIDSEKLQGLNKDVIEYLKQLKAGEFEDRYSTGGSEGDADEVVEKADEIRDPESLKCFSEKKIVSEEISVQKQSCTAVANGNAQVEELEKLQRIVSEKDNIIQELQNNNAMLLKMIESKSVSVYGDKSLLELHQLSNDVKDLKLEKEQMISVMDEKTRECSSLKAEVHRLMAIVSEERNAIDHLQLENQQLLQSQNKVVSNDASEAGGMQKEALQKLSNIIRDKDVEIDALKQKNKTLLTIFQDSSQSGPQINSLIQDKENLKKQLGVLQAERDQIVSYLNQKHQESVAYHNEIQRLNAYIQNEAEKYDQLKCEHDRLMPLYEDRNQTLIKTQNELVNYKQKYSELEAKYEELLQRSNVSETVDVITYNNKVEEISFLQERLSKVQAALTEQEQKVQGQLHSNNDTERTLREIELERNNLKKQYDSLTFQFSELQTKLNELKTEIASSQRLNEEHNIEISALKEINHKLSLTIQQKEFELRNVTEKANTVTAMLQKQQGERSELDLLLRESESIRQQAVQFQQERDQVILSMRNLQTEKEEMTKEMQKFRDRNDKQNRELERLKMHLLQIEEAYTKEALDSEEREKNLRNKLAATEEKAYITAAAVESAGQHSSAQIENMNQQLHALASQRDNAYLQLSTYQEQCKQYATSLMNLQMVLEQFQAERESQMTAEKQKNEAEQNHLRALIENLQSSLQDTQEKLSEAEDGLQAAERLSEQIDLKMNHIEQLKAEVEEKEKLLKEADQEIHRLKFDSEAFVDKLVMKNLIINYLSTSQTKKGDVLRLIGGILEFSPEDFSKAEGSFRKSWVLGFFQTSSIPPSVSPKPSPSKFNKSFSELFVNFLEKESSPPPPALRMKTETLEKEVRSKGKVKKESHERNFNPFTAPRHVAMPIPINDHLSTQGQHLLMAPMAPNFPVLSPLSSGSQTNPPQVGLMSSSTILNDVLTQKS
ncbi:thyroid receptor-interacting protein 11 isoform X3 [Octopus sinensis]|uniref:Thyroid receptor-interacting protein 11 isoform X3 n=1 Tax=Octopus sinensis TaxID=2607531 RepID=A0A7E6F6A4_9MOLL|nr:thyroid receptor-interacting protein 11 isoform X3 [Octopus sinensis]